METPAAPAVSGPIAAAISAANQDLGRLQAEIIARSGMIDAVSLVAERVFQEAIGNEEGFKKRFEFVTLNNPMLGPDEICKQTVEYYMSRAKTIALGMRQKLIDEQKQASGEVKAAKRYMASLEVVQRSVEGKQ